MYNKFDLFFADRNSMSPNKYYKNNSIIIRPSIIWDILLLFDFTSEDQKVYLIYWNKI